MLVTVLLIGVAASIAFALARQALLESQASRVTVDLNAASDTARSTIAKLQGVMEVDPLRFTREVLGGEPERLCLMGENVGQRYGAKAAWPASCGLVWTYDDSDYWWTGVRTELSPPGPGNPYLVATVSVRTETADVRLAARFAARGTNRFTWVNAAGEPVNVASPSPNQNVTVRGALYASSITGLSSVGTAGVAAVGPIAAETFDPSPPQNVPPGVTYAEGSAARALTAESVSAGVVAGAANVLRSVGCAGVGDALVAGRSGHLCLQAGGTAIDVNGNLVTIPEGVTSYALVPYQLANEPARIAVWYSTAAVNFADDGPLSCSGWPACVLAPSGQQLLEADSHPAGLSYWQNASIGSGKLGDFGYPTTGVIATDGVTFFGICHANGSSGGIGSSCVAADAVVGSATLYPATPGVATTDSLTVVGAAVVVNSPVTAIGSGRVGLVADGLGPSAPAATVWLPYWTQGAAGTTAIDAHLVSAGQRNGLLASTRGVSTFPAAWDAGSAVNNKSILNISGSVTTVNSQLGIGGYNQVVYRPSNSNVAPPWLHVLGVAWSLVDITTPAI